MINIKIIGGVMECWYCKSKMMWVGDFNYDEVYEVGGWIVTYLECSECDAKAQFEIKGIGNEY